MNSMAICMTLILFATQANAFCFEEAAERYGVSPLLLMAISDVESNGDIAAVNVNNNGSADVGHMQINSFWKKHLGGGWDILRSDPCYCSMAGAWILGECVVRYGYNWNAVACYHIGTGLGDSGDAARSRRGRAYVNRVKKALLERGYGN